MTTLFLFKKRNESRQASGFGGCGQKTNDKRGASFEFPVTGCQRLVVGSYGSAPIVCDVIINELNLTCAFLSPLYSFKLITPRVSFIISITTTPLVIYQVTRARDFAQCYLTCLLHRFVIDVNDCRSLL